MSRHQWPLLSLTLGLATLCGQPVRGAEEAAGRVVNLPPFIVEDSVSALRWRYAQFNHFEILSVCSDSTTKEFLRELDRLERQLNSVLPSQFRFETSVPITYILCDSKIQQRLDKDIPVEMFLNRDSVTSAATGSPPRQHFVTIPHLGLQDADAYMNFVLLDSHDLGDSQIAYLPDAIAYLLIQRTPALPSWFVSGFMSLYGTWSFTQPGDVTRIPMPLTNYGTYPKIGGYQVSISSDVTAGVFSPPFVWVSPKEGKLLHAKLSSRLANNRPVASLLLPMEDLFVKANPPEKEGPVADRYRRIWTAQAALFVQWALDDQNRGSLDGHGPGRDLLWKFLSRSGAEPVTEAMFQDCFGLNFEAMREKLGHYLLVASSQTKNLGVGDSDSAPIPIRDATADEVARIKGDWERMEVGFVKKTYPALSADYQEHAHQTLWHAYDRGDRDSRLLAAMGLFECDTGDDAAARPFLIAATTAHVVRPRAYSELARIFYAEAAAKPGGANGKLSAAQTAAVLALLGEARKQSPSLLSACKLFANVWFHSEVAPSKSDLAELDADAVLFSRSPSLTFQTALLEAHAGLISEAHRLIDRGLEYVADGSDKARLLQLKTVITTAEAGK